jgi:hypothetical protein
MCAYILVQQMQLTTLNGNGTNNKVHQTQQVQIPNSLEYRPEDMPNTDIVKGLKLPPLSLKLNQWEKSQQAPPPPPPKPKKFNVTFVLKAPELTSCAHARARTHTQTNKQRTPTLKITIGAYWEECH